jgi:hypothetical protein
MAISVIKTPVDNNILSGSAVTLVNSVNQVRSFGVTGDYVEFNIYDLNNRFLYQQSPFNGYKIPGDYPSTEGEILYQELEFDPSQDIQNVGFSYGNYILEYNILRPKIINTSDKIFFIKEISADRTEIRISTNNVSNTT